jgi:Tol biopolymer transport system component
MNWLIRFIFTLFLLHLLLVVLMFAVGGYTAAGGVIAYTRIDADYNPHVMLIDARLGNSLELTMPPFEGRNPRWTPDGNRIIFPTVRNRDERQTLEITLPTYQTRNLTALWGFESVPIYSPVDNRIAFPMNPANGNMPLFVVDGANPAVEPELLLTEFRGNVTWSPDGQYLAYTRFPQASENELAAAVDEVLPPNLYMTNLSTGETTNWLENMQSLGAPLWSPDSTRLAVPLTIPVANNVRIIDITTGAVTILATPAAGAQNLVWSPDGRYFAYTSRENNDYEIFVTEIATGAFRNVSHSPLYDINPTWSTDSKHLAYISRRNGQDDIYIVNIEADTTYRLTYTPENETEVVWQPR